MGLVFHLFYPRYSGPLTPTAPTATKLWETFTFLPHRSVFNSLPRTCETRMVVHGQLVEPAVCLSGLYDVFLLDIVRDTRQNLWTMIHRSQ